MRELWHWREREAETADLPVFKVMRSELLLDLAAWCAAHPKMTPMGAPCWPRRTSPGRAERAARSDRKGPPIAPPVPPPPRPETAAAQRRAAEVRMEKLRTTTGTRWRRN